MSKQTLIIFYWMLLERQRFVKGLIGPDMVDAA